MIEHLEKNKSVYRIAHLALVSSILWIVSCMMGEGISGSWGQNSSCLPFFGCATGFFGFDIVEHFLFGMAATFTLVWLFKKYPKYSLFNDKRWKDFLTLIALVALMSTVWEFVECAHDVFRMDILHEIVINLKLNVNLLNQPTNLDTIGDMVFSFLGSIAALFFL